MEEPVRLWRSPRARGRERALWRSRFGSGVLHEPGDGSELCGGAGSALAFSTSPGTGASSVEEPVRLWRSPRARGRERALWRSRFGSGVLHEPGDGSELCGGAGSALAFSTSPGTGASSVEEPVRLWRSPRARGRERALWRSRFGSGVLHEPGDGSELCGGAGSALAFSTSPGTGASSVEEPVRLWRSPRARGRERALWRSRFGSGVLHEPGDGSELCGGAGSALAFSTSPGTGASSVEEPVRLWRSHIPALESGIG